MGAHKVNKIALAAKAGNYDEARMLKIVQLVTDEDSLQQLLRSVPYEDREMLEIALRQMTGLPDESGSNPTETPAQN